MIQEFPISPDFYCSEPVESDVAAFVEFLNDREIYDRTLVIPFPYSEADANWFIHHCRETKAAFGHALNFAIRNREGLLIGGAGYHGKNTFAAVAHRDELGYWLAAPFRNKGIMSMAVPALVEYGKTVRGLTRFEAPVFAFNTASERVLLKSGFTEEAYIKNAYRKDGVEIDAKLFSLVRH